MNQYHEKYTFHYHINYGLKYKQPPTSRCISHGIIEGLKPSPFKLILISTKMQFAFRKHTMHARLFPKSLHGMETSHCFYAKWVGRPMMSSLWTILEISYTCFLLIALCMNWPFHTKMLPIVSFNCNWSGSSLSFVMSKEILPKPSIIFTSCTRYHPVSTWVQWCTPCLMHSQLLERLKCESK
jgi:hypothetical protein